MRLHKKEHLAKFSGQEGILYIGKAQEKFNTFRVNKKFDADTGRSFPRPTRGTVMCNHDYF